MTSTVLQSSGNFETGISTELEIRSSTGGEVAAVFFHEPGNFATYFGLKDGDFYQGGFSDGAVRHKFYTSKNFDLLKKRSVNVLDHGARMDGSWDAPAYNDARAATGYNGVIEVPPGQIWQDVPVDQTKCVLWKLSGNTYAGNNVLVWGIGSDIVETFEQPNGRMLGQTQTTAGSNALSTIQRNVTHTGGGSGNLQTSRVNTNVIGEPSTFVWGFTSTLVTKSHNPQGNDVAGYFQAWRDGTGTTPMWAGCFEARDKTGLNSDQTGPMLGVEIGVFGQGFDIANQRLGADIVVGYNVYAPNDPIPDAGRFEAYAGVRISTVGGSQWNKERCWVKRGFAVESGVSDSAFDASLVVWQPGSYRIALRTGHANVIDFSSSSSVLLGYLDNRGLKYKKDGVSMWSINDDLTQYAPDMSYDPASNPSAGSAGDWGFYGNRLYRKTSSGWYYLAMSPI